MMRSKKLYVERQKRALKAAGTDVLYLEDPISLFYLTGYKLSRGAILLSKKGVTLFVDGRYFDACKDAPCKVEKLSDENIKLKWSGTLCFDSSLISMEREKVLKRMLKSSRAKPLFFPSPLKTVRAIKDSFELAAIEKSAKLLWKGFLYAKKLIKVGITEKELAKAFEIFVLKEGAEGLAFPVIAAFGENSAYPHHESSNRKLKSGDVVLLDIGVIVDRYRSDMTRILYCGKKDPKIVSLQKIVTQAKEAALALCKPGVKLKQLDEAARKVMRENKLEDLFLHSLGHGIGLETHEFPIINSTGKDSEVKLEENMVITIEPGLYKRGVGGIREEEMICITKKGYKNFYPE